LTGIPIPVLLLQLPDLDQVDQTTCSWCGKTRAIATVPARSASSAVASSNTRPAPTSAGLTQRIDRHRAATVSEAGRAAENRCPATLSARLSWHGKHCCPCRRPPPGRRPPGSERRACGGASVAKGDADPEDEDDGQQATPQTSKERRKVRYRRGEPAGSRPPAHTPTAHSTGSVKVYGDPDR
jgi:hypothetical protein